MLKIHRARRHDRRSLNRFERRHPRFYIEFQLTVQTVPEQSGIAARHDGNACLVESPDHRLVLLHLPVKPLALTGWCAERHKLRSQRIRGLVDTRLERW